MTRKDGKTRLDMLDWQAEAYLHPDRQTTDGTESSETIRGSRPRLNPAFACWLMGIPSLWTNPDVISSEQLEMAAWRSVARQHLQHLLGESLSEETAE